MSYSRLHSQSKANSCRGEWLTNTAARVVSDCTNPLLVPTVFFLLLGYLLPLYYIEAVWISGLAFIFFTLLPFSSAIYLLRSGHIQSLDIPARQNRDKLFLASLISITAGSIVLLQLGVDGYPLFTETVLVFLLNPLFGYVINRRFKISIHTAALATAGTLLLIFYLQLPELRGSAGLLSFVLFVVIIPAVSWSRAHLKIHTLQELVAGVAAGFGCTLLEIGILQLIW